MTIDTSKEAVERLLDGVTPGPWGQDGPVSAKIVWAGPDLRVCFLTSDGPASKNARFIAAARELVPALAAERDAQTARADAAEAEVARLKDENERLRSLVDSAHGIFANCEVSAGVCCCGENMDGHSNPMECGHSPVDMGDYSAGQWLASIQRKAGE